MALTQITYTNKETLNEQPSIADKNKVKADDMNEIKSVVNTNASNVGDLANLNTTANTSIVAAINELKGGEVYSTSEVKTNKVWIDGKPIYRKVFEKTNVSTGYIQHTHDISTLETLVKAEGILYYTSGYQYIPNVVADNITGYGAGILNITNAKFNTLLGTSIPTTNKMYIILEYTKSTD